MPNELLHMHNTILHPEVCSFIIPRFNKNGTFCTLDMSGVHRRAACGGDSGSPMICKGTNGPFSSNELRFQSSNDMLS